jgi:TonB family protein
MDSFLILIALKSIALRTAGLWALATAAIFAFRVKSPATRHAVWTLVTAAMLLLPILQLAAPKLPLRLLDAPAPVVAHPPVATLSLPLAPQSQTTHWESVAVAIWVAGALLLLGRLAYGYGFALRLVRAARDVEESVMESDWIAVPVTIGSRVVLPANWREWTAEKRESVLAHELAHVQRRDWAISAMAAVNRAIFWFHPAAWWLERTLASLAEQACDDAAVAKVGSREAYAAALVEIAAMARASAGRIIWEAMAMARSGQVRKRVERILNETRELSRSVSPRRWAAMALCALPVLWVAAAVKVTRAQPAPMPIPAVEAADQEPAAPSSEAQTAALEKLKALEAQIATFKQQNIGRLPEQFQANIQEIQVLQLRLGNTNEQLGALQRRKLSLETQLQNTMSRARFYEAQGTQVQGLEHRVGEAEGALAAARQTYAPNHPQIRQMEAALGLLKLELVVKRAEATQSGGAPPQTRLEAEAAGNTLKTEIQNTNLEIEERVKQVQSINSQLATLTARVENTPELERRYADLLREYQMAKQYLENAPTTGPALISRAEPEYTAAAKSAGIQGKVELSITIGTDGIARDIQVIRSLDPGLDKQAIECVTKWRFRPASRGGHPVTAFATVEVDFKL